MTAVSHVVGQITVSHDVIERRYDPRRFVGRRWLVEEVTRLQNSTERRHLVVVGAPGSGKSALVAYLAATLNCPRHFIRVGSTDGVAGVDPRSFLVSLGAQLYQKYGKRLFPGSSAATIKVDARWTQDQAQVIGRFIDRLYTLPFLPVDSADIHVRSTIARGQAQVIGERVREVCNVAHMLPETTLLHVAVLDPLRRLHELYPDERVLVLIDALDESMHHPSTKLIDVIPRRDDPDFPPNLRIVMTSRPGNHLVRFDTKDLLRLDDSMKGFLQQGYKDARAYVEARLSAAPFPAALQALAPRDAETWIAQIRSKTTEGQPGATSNFLYLYHWLNELAEAVTQGKQFRTIPVPADLDDIYRFFAVERIKGDTNLQDWVEVYLPILGVLAVIREPVDREQLAGFAAVRVEYVDYVTCKLEQFLDIVPFQSTQRRYALYHSSFGEYLLDQSRNRDYPIPAACYHYRVAAHYRGASKRWPDVDWSVTKAGYPFRHLASHLSLSAFPDELYELISKSWMDAHFKRTGSHAAFASDLESAAELAEAGNPPRLVQQARAYLAASVLSAVSVNLPPTLMGAMAQLGQPDRALDHALLIKDPRRRNDALCDVALAAARKGETADAAALFDRAVGLAGGDKDFRTGWLVWARLSAAMLRAGDRSRAADIARRTICEYGANPLNSGAIAWYAIELARAGLSEGALACVPLVEEFDREKTLVMILDALVKAGHSTAALRAAETMLLPRWQFPYGVPVLAAVVEGLAREGQSPLARDVASRCAAFAEAVPEDNVFRGALLAQAGGAFDRVQAGDRGTSFAARAVAWSEDGAQRGDAAWALAGAARGLALARRIDLAEQIARRISSLGDGSKAATTRAAGQALKELARAAAGTGDASRARQFAKEAIDLEAQAVNTPRFRFADIDGVLDEETSYLPHVLLRDVTTILLDRGDADEALATAYMIPDAKLQNELVTSVAAKMAAAGDITRATSIVAGLDDPFQEARVAAEAAVQLEALGKHCDAMELVQAAMNRASSLRGDDFDWSSFEEVLGSTLTNCEGSEASRQGARVAREMAKSELPDRTAAVERARAELRGLLDKTSNTSELLSSLTSDSSARERPEQADRFASALVTVTGQIADGYARNLTLRDMAYALARAGLGKRVLQVVQLMGDPKREASARVLAGCLNIVAQSGYVEQVLPMSVAALKHASIFGLPEYLYALGVVVRALGSTGRCDNVRMIHHAVREVQSWFVPSRTNPYEKREAIANL